MEQETPGAAIGRRVRRLRDHGLWTRSELADRAGISRHAITHLELGISARPRRGTIEKLAGALGVGVETLLEDAPLPRSREEAAFVVVGRIVADGNGDERVRMAVQWNVPPQERGPYRKDLHELLGDDYLEEEMSPEAAELLATGAA
jgi:transcriptional regulator with XRE-family HTH domain